MTVIEAMECLRSENINQPVMDCFGNSREENNNCLVHLSDNFENNNKHDILEPVKLLEENNNKSSMLNAHVNLNQVGSMLNVDNNEEKQTDVFEVQDHEEEKLFDVLDLENNIKSLQNVSRNSEPLHDLIVNFIHRFDSSDSESCVQLEHYSNCKLLFF